MSLVLVCVLRADSGPEPGGTTTGGCGEIGRFQSDRSQEIGRRLLVGPGRPGIILTGAPDQRQSQRNAAMYKGSTLALLHFRQLDFRKTTVVALKGNFFFHFISILILLLFHCSRVLMLLL